MRPSVAIVLMLSAAGQVVAAVPVVAQGQPHPQSGVVRIDANECAGRSRRGSGFVWQSPGTVVTALHIVAGCNTIGVRYPVAGGNYKIATVTRVLRGADLVLLSVADAPPVAAMRAATLPPQPGARLVVWGYPSIVRGLLDTELQRRSMGGVLSDLLNPQLLAQIQSVGMPSPSAEVILLERGNLLPGHSGAPILDTQGRVAAIANGGLERGAVQVSWAIPASRLAALRASTEDVPVNVAQLNFLFAADLQESTNADDFAVVLSTEPDAGGDLPSSVAMSVACGTGEFVHVRTRALGDLRSTADDVVGLGQLMAAAGPYISQADSFAVYQDLRSSAVVVVPAGAPLSQSSTGCYARSPSGGVEQVVTLAGASSLFEIQQQSMLFEQRWLQSIGNGQLIPDVQWTQGAPWYRADSTMIRRGAYFVPQPSVPNQKYVFETLAAKTGSFLGVAAVRHAYLPSVQQTQAQCLANHTIAGSPQCSVVLTDLRWQVMMTIATHLSSYSIG